MRTVFETLLEVASLALAGLDWQAATNFEFREPELPPAA